MSYFRLLRWPVAFVFFSFGGLSVERLATAQPAEPPPTAAAEDAAHADWRAARRAADATFQAKLAALADRCDRLELAAQAETTRKWFIPRDPGRRYVFLPHLHDATAPAADAPQVVQQWHAKFRELRAAQADALLLAARRALAAHEPTQAYALLHEALRENPEHAAVRRALELPPSTQPAARDGKTREKSPRNSADDETTSKLKAVTPTVEHPRLGWKRGQYWRVESPHFRIVTNQNAAAAIELANRLEAVYAAWRQVCFSFWSREAALAARLAGGDDPLGPSRKHDVVLFRNRADYVAKLKPSQPRIDITLGIYLDEQKAAYLFSSDTEDVAPTWAHEIAHQLFQESEQTPPGVGTKANMWAAEAAALYFESFRQDDGYCTVGGQDADRLQFARYSLLRGDAVMPLERLAALGREELQSHADIGKLYRQSAVAGHLLFDGGEGRYAEGWIEFLRQLYAGRAGPEALFQRLGVAGADLDRRLLDYLVLTDADLARWPALASAKNLSFTRATITDGGLGRLKGGGRLEWLDLSLTGAGDEGLGVFREATKLKQLFLEHTRLTDAGLEVAAGFRDLEELDLSHTAITDRGLEQVAQLKKLRKLFLTGCAITDEGVARLKTLKQLDLLDVSETQVTDEALARLRRSLPKLKP